LSVDRLIAMASSYNPRTIDDHELSALRRSLRTFGAVLYVDLDDAGEKQLNLALRRRSR
jgi:hypothetical protein